MSKCGYRIDFAGGSRICKDESEDRCFNCNTWFCENHKELLSECKECEEKTRCIYCPEICKICSKESSNCAICHCYLPMREICEDCGKFNCGKCLEDLDGSKCDDCGKLGCCTTLKPTSDLRYFYCVEECYSSNTE